MARSRTADEQEYVSVSLFADLRKYLRHGERSTKSVIIRPGDTVGDLLAALGIPSGEQVTVGVNGELVSRDSPLRDGDEVALFSPMEGG